MKKITVFLLTFLLSFCFLIAGFGYAKISRSLAVEGNIHAEMPKSIFISKVALQALNDATGRINSHAQRTLNSTVTLGNSDGASIAYQIEFYNNTDKDMAFVSAFHDSTAYDNSDITYAAIDVLSGQIIPRNGRLTLTLTFAYRDGVSTDKTLNSVIGFRFGEVIDFEEEEEQEKEDGTFEPGESYKTLVQNVLTNSNRYGLNDSHKGYVLHDALTEKKILYSTDHTTGGNIDKLYQALQIDASKKH